MFGVERDPFSVFNLIGRLRVASLVVCVRVDPSECKFPTMGKKKGSKKGKAKGGGGGDSAGSAEAVAAARAQSELLALKSKLGALLTLLALAVSPFLRPWSLLLPFLKLKCLLTFVCLDLLLHCTSTSGGTTCKLCRHAKIRRVG